MNKRKKQLLWLAVGLIVMFPCAYLLPTIGDLSRMGMKVLGLLAGMVIIMSGYGDMIVSSYIGLGGLVASGYMTGTAALNKFMGNATIVQMIFMAAFCYIIQQTGATDTLAKKIMSIKAAQGRPVVFSAVFLIACGICGIIMSPTSVLPVYLALWEGVRKQIGMEPEHKYSRLMMMGIFISMFIGTAILPFKGLLATWIAYFEQVFSEAGFTFDLNLHMLIVFCILIVFCVLYALAIKYIWRADLSALKGFDISKSEGMSKEDLKFTNRQIVVLASFVLTMMYAFIPTFLPAGDFLTAWNKWHLTIVAMVVMAILAILRCPEDGKPYANLIESMQKGVPWAAYLGAFSFLLLSGAMTDAELGIGSTMIGMLGFMSNLNWVAFTFFAILIPHIITNFFSNMGTFMLMASVVAPLAAGYHAQGMNLTILGTGLICASLNAYWTAAGNPAAPWLFEREGMNQPWVFKNGLFSSAILVFVLWIFAAFISPLT